MHKIASSTHRIHKKSEDKKLGATTKDGVEKSDFYFDQIAKENQELKWSFSKDLYDCNLLPADKDLIPYIRDSISS